MRWRTKTQTRIQHAIDHSFKLQDGKVKKILLRGLESALRQPRERASLAYNAHPGGGPAKPAGGGNGIPGGKPGGRKPGGGPGIPGGAKGIGGRAMPGIPTENRLVSTRRHAARSGTHSEASCPCRVLQAYHVQGQQGAGKKDGRE